MALSNNPSLNKTFNAIHLFYNRSHFYFFIPILHSPTLVHMCHHSTSNFDLHIQDNINIITNEVKTYINSPETKLQNLLDDKSYLNVCELFIEIMSSINPKLSDPFLCSPSSCNYYYPLLCFSC